MDRNIPYQTYITELGRSLWEGATRIGRQTRSRWASFRHDYPWTFRLSMVGLALVVLTVISVSILLLAVRQGYFGGMPTSSDLRAISNPVASEVYDKDGVLLGRFYLENRTEVDYKQLPDHLINALIATEDARFYSHAGIDWEAWGRVFYKSILHNEPSSGGGSTLSQQLAKNLFPRRDYNYSPTVSLGINKLREVIIARRLESMYSKNEILELYLNTVPFSDNTFGIRSAALRFFQKEPSELEPQESATLVAMLKATSTYNPHYNPQASRERRNLVLSLMHEQGYIDRHLRDSLAGGDLCLNYMRFDNNSGPATYFRENIRLEINNYLENLRKPDGGRYNIYTDGLRIYTTLDSRMQAYAEAAVHEHMSELQEDFDRHLRGRNPWETEEGLLMSMRQSPLYRELRLAGLSHKQIDSVFNTPRNMVIKEPNGKLVTKTISPMDSLKYYLSFLNAGFLVADHHTGEVKAWVGGIDHRFSKYDHIKSRRQTGSAFKPVVYAKALQSGMRPCQYLSNYLRTYREYDNWRPQNADNRYGGRYSLHGGLSRSVNTIAVQVIMRTGPDKVAELARELGIKNEVPPVPSIALGTVEASLYEMAHVYATFANNGLRPDFYYIDRIETRNGKVIYRHQPEQQRPERVLSEEHAQMMLHMLENVVNHGTGQRLRWRYKLEGDLAGKTGTTQNHSDGWFMGLTPKLVGGAWVGGESTAVRFRDMSMGQGASMALPIWGLFLQKLNADERYVDWAKSKFPEPLETVADAFNCPAFRYNFFPSMEPSPEEPEVEEAALDPLPTTNPLKQIGR